MNWDVIEGNWAQDKGQAKAQWGKSRLFKST